MSRVIDILKTIQNGETYNKEAFSRAEEILKAICNNTSITMTARTRYETLLLCLKNKTTTTLTPRTRLEEILVAIINGTIDTWLTGKNLFDKSTFRQGGAGYNSPYRVHSDFYTPFNHTKNYIITTNLDTTIYQYAVNGSPIKGIATAGVIYDSGWLTTQKYEVKSNVAKLETKYLGFVISRIDGVMLSAEEIKQFNFKIELGTTATPYSPYCFLSELEEEYYKTFGV